ncbi:MAG: hypothetical protein RSJ41_05360 [Clostridia bacterium]
MRDAYVPNFKVPGRKKPSHKMLLTLLLCVLLPPVGLILLWGRATCPTRGKVWISLISVAVMVAGMTYYIGTRAGDDYIVPDAPIAHTYGLATPAPAPSVAPAPVETVEKDAQAGEEVAPETIPGVIPANPMG